MSKKSPPKAMVIGWKIIGHILLKAGIPEVTVKQLAPIWVKIYQEDRCFNPNNIAARFSVAMENQLISETKLRKKLFLAKTKYGYLLETDQFIDENPEIRVFNALMAYILIRLKEMTNISHIQEDLVTSKISHLDLSANSFIEIEQWRINLIDTPPEENIIELEHKDIKIFLHCIYTWICEEIGPMSTDELFADAIRTVEAMPEASRCHPKSFL